MSQTEAEQRFSSVLERQSALYAKAFGRLFLPRVHHIRNIHIGQITFDLGVRDWVPWIESGSDGIAWNGVCEHYLGHVWNDDSLRTVKSTIDHCPRELGSWDGRWLACTWSKENATVVTATTDCPSFWWAEGPNGWVCGSRGLPILELVGRKPEIDPIAASTYLSYGYLMGANSLLQGVQRLSARQMVVLEPLSRPRISSFLSLGEYYAGASEMVGTKKRLQLCSDRLEERVSQQLQFSPDPELLLSGGRDSRCIAATLVKVGYKGVAVTSGPLASLDVKIAKTVADHLGLQHRHIVQEEGRPPMQAVLQDNASVRSWVKLSEATTTVRFAVPYQGFFQGVRPYPERVVQIFHGLHGLAHGLGSEVNRELASRLSRSNAPIQASRADMLFVRGIVEGKWHPGLVHHKEAFGVVEEVCRGYDEEAKSMGANVAQWLALFYREDRSLHWGEDLLAIKDVLGWNWTPLLDRVLNQAFWQVNAEGDVEPDFVAELNTVAAKRLKGIDYDRRSPGTALTPARIAQRALAKAQRLVGRVFPGYANRDLPIPIDDSLQTFWETMLLGENARVWPDLIRREAIEELIEHDPLSEVLWGAASLELFADELENS